MGIQPIPQQQPRPVQFAVQGTQEGDDLLGVDVGVGMEAEIKPALAATQTQDGDDGDLLMMHAALQQQRCLTPRRPAAAHQRGHQKAAFIEKHQPGIQATGFFLMALQVWRIQWRTAFSSRSMARRWGFWGLQPKECGGPLRPGCSPPEAGRDRETVAVPILGDSREVASIPPGVQYRTLLMQESIKPTSKKLRFGRAEESVSKLSFRLV